MAKVLDAIMGRRHGPAAPRTRSTGSGNRCDAIVSDRWGQEAVLYHNANASHPIPEGLFDGVSEASLDVGGTYKVKPGHPFSQYMSCTNLFLGSARFQEARIVETGTRQVLGASYALSSTREGNPLWS